jgi:hypothetical protein
MSKAISRLPHQVMASKSKGEGKKTEHGMAHFVHKKDLRLPSNASVFITRHCSDKGLGIRTI